MVTKDRCNFLLLMLAICFAPFYLVVKAFYIETFLWVSHALVVSVLFTILFCNKLVKGHFRLVNDLDLWMHIILLYSIWLCFLALLLGSIPSQTFRVLWQNILPILVYFVGLKYLNIRRLTTIQNVFCLLSCFMAIFFLTEWVNVNVLGHKSFGLSLQVHQMSNVKEKFIAFSSAGGSRLPDADAIAWGGVRRIGSIMGYHFRIALFMCLGAIFSYFRLLFFGVRSKYSFLFVFVFTVCLVGVVVSLSRIVTFSLFISVFISTGFFIKRKRKTVIKSGIIISIFIIIGLAVGGARLQNLLWMGIYETGIKGFARYEQAHVEGGGSALVSMAKFIGEKFASEPLLTITGSGFGYFSKGEIVRLRAGDWGYVSVFGKIGVLGVLLILFINLSTIKKTYKIMKNRNIPLHPKYMAISCQTFILTSIFGTFHYGAVFYQGNYYIFFMTFAIINYIGFYYQSGVRKPNSFQIGRLSRRKVR